MGNFFDIRMLSWDTQNGLGDISTLKAYGAKAKHSALPSHSNSCEAEMPIATRTI